MKDSFTAPSFEWRWLHPRYGVTWLGVGLLLPLAYAPWQLRWWLGKQLGRLLYKYQTKRRAIVEINLKLCYPQLSDVERHQLALQHLQHYAAALLDYSVLFFRSRATLAQRIQLQLPTTFQQALADHKPIMLLLAHSTWLEFAPLAIGLNYAAYGSYKPLSNPIFDWLIARSRLKDVQFVIPREAGLLKLVRALKPGLILIFLPDEDLGLKASVFAPFMGQTKATLTTPARIADLSKAHCFAALAGFNPQSGYYRIAMSERLQAYPSGDAERDATTLNQALEQLIALYPEQYLWLLKIFKTHPEGLNIYSQTPLTN
ncbi:MAG: lysophospholipid acyltransferase family protein [Thiofilum sp.]|uniref:lysophospholipid acyltransferase family protein n=1 Tax=Thiofilum sp. TaxID=2212733 RepID=UPI0025DD83B5|nr:lysophospholipid acyltransferase family protein [Thiofilum sp.]MBK8453166.1 lysophospholipid acyltransferase family protein [Thiofilum sp.]